MKLKRIHVNQHNVKSNKKNNCCEKPVITVKYNKKTFTGNKVFIEGNSSLVYKKDNPLSCGAT